MQEYNGNVSSNAAPSPDAIFVDNCILDNGEPLLSGTGTVSKDCSQGELMSWGDVLKDWKSTHEKPKQLHKLVKRGIPEVLRGEVWQRLAGTEDDLKIMDHYRILIAQRCEFEDDIEKDVSRTFPANNFFKQINGLGQTSLFRVVKAYALYDSEVTYCQGISFLAAALLLEMPEEQAFCVLVKMMFQYDLRSLYKNSFEGLRLRLYQLNGLMKKFLRPLRKHFSEQGIEVEMFASNWFLTLFTTKFPVNFAFRVLDIFLLQGMDTLFQISLALLKIHKKQLLELDFGNLLSYVQTQLPRECSKEENVYKIIKAACQIKIDKERLEKYATEFENYWEVVTLDTLAESTVTDASDEYSSNEITESQPNSENQRLNGKSTDIHSTDVIAKYEFLKETVRRCERCCKLIEDQSSHNIDDPQKDRYESSLPLDHLKALERIKELELELERTKLMRFEMECRNEDLLHRLQKTEMALSIANEKLAVLTEGLQTK